MPCAMRSSLPMPRPVNIFINVRHCFFCRAFGNLLRKLPQFARHFCHQVFQPAHVPHLLDLCFEVVQIKAFAAVQLLGHFFGDFFVYAFLHVFNQRNYVAHAQNAAGNAVGVECFQSVDFFADAEELNRLARNLSDRQCGTAA